MKQFRADLHIHSVLSPCAAPEMTPAAIVRQAAQIGLHIVAICDHNTAENAAAVQRAAKSALAVFAGIEISTREEAHVIGIFSRASDAEAVGSNVRETLPPLTNPPSWMGDQRVVTATGKVRRKETAMLAAASDLALKRAVDLIHEHDGIAIAAHVDRPSFSVTSQLGFVPLDAGFDALELSASGVQQGRGADFEHLGLPLISSSDSHSLSEIGAAFTTFEMAEPTFDEMLLAMRHRSGRRCWLA
jgi:3',5'-nucleoside bisphosphate phosphatase